VTKLMTTSKIFFKASAPVQFKPCCLAVRNQRPEKHITPCRKCWYIHNKPHGTITYKATICGFNLCYSPTKNNKSHPIASVRKSVHPYSTFQWPHVSVIQHPLQPCGSSQEGRDPNGKCTYNVTLWRVFESLHVLHF
jgi:hypothetical protein